MKGLIHRQPADLLETDERLKGNEPGIYTFSYLTKKELKSHQEKQICISFSKFFFFLNRKSADSFHVLIKYSNLLNTSFFKMFVQFFIGSLDNLLLKTIIDQ